MIWRKKSFAKVFLLLVLLLLLSQSATALAGQGKFTPPTWTNKATYTIDKSGRLDIHVFLDRRLSGATWSEANLKAYFGQISRELYDATERQVQLGKVRIYRAKPGAEDKADLIVSPSVSGAYTYAGKFGEDSALGKIYTTPSAVSAATRATQVHELGHLLFGIYDSYVGWLKGTILGIDDLQPNAANTGWEWKTADYYWNNSNHGLLPTAANDGRNTPTSDAVFYDNTPWNDGSTCCLMDGPDTGETEFSTPVSGSTNWSTEHLPDRENVTVRWYTAPNKSALNPPFETEVDVVTKQNQKNSDESAWETMVRTFPAMAIPIAQPVSGDTTGHVSFDAAPDDDVELIIMPDVNQIGVVIDRSGSMGYTDMNLAKRAAGVVVDLSHRQEQVTVNGEVLDVAGDWLSVVSFSSSATVNYAPGGAVAEMTDANKTAAKAAIAAINSGGLTSIGSGLAASHGTLAQPDAPKNIIVMSDGHENSSPYISSVTPALVNDDVRVFSVAMGTGADASALRSLATATGGKFFFASNSSQLTGIFSQIYSGMRDESAIRTQGGMANFTASLVDERTGMPVTAEQRNIISPFTRMDLRPEDRQTAGSLLAVNQAMVFEHVTIDSMVGEATFLLSWDYGSGDVSLRDPNGRTIDEATAVSDPDIDFIAVEGYALYRVRNIVSGNWQVIFDFVEQDVQWEMRVFGIDDAISCSAGAGQGSYNYGDSIVLQASCGVPQPVVGATVWAVVVGPDGRETFTTLFDNGSAANGDEYAGDGQYSTIFHPTGGNGNYTITSIFDSTGGTTPDGASPGIEVSRGTVLTPQPVAEFHRYNQFTFDLSGSPPYWQDTDFDGMPDLWEDANGLDRNNPDDADDDPDLDRLINLDEYNENTNPHLKDTDGDSWSDYIELIVGTDPCDRLSVPTNIATYNMANTILFIPEVQIGGNTRKAYKAWLQLLPGEDRSFQVLGVKKTTPSTTPAAIIDPTNGQVDVYIVTVKGLKGSRYAVLKKRPLGLVFDLVSLRKN